MCSYTIHRPEVVQLMNCISFIGRDGQMAGGLFLAQRVGYLRKWITQEARAVFTQVVDINTWNIWD